MPLGQRAIVTFIWFLATAGVLATSAFLPNGIGKDIVLVAGLSMLLTFLALLFLLLAEAIAPERRPAG